MREKIENILSYILRGWNEEPDPPHPLMKILPPFIYELISYLIGLLILYRVGLYLWDSI